MSWKEYARTRHPVPYVLEAAAANGALVYFGAEHMGAARGLPTHPEVGQIVRAWERFKPTLALYEGRSTFGRELPSLSEAAAKAGEGGVLRFLAARDAVSMRSLEPSSEDEVRALRSWFSKEQIRLFYVLRCVAQNCTGAGTPEDQATRWFQRAGQGPELAGAPRTIEDLEHSTRRLLPKLSDWRTVSLGLLDPAPRGAETFLNSVSRRSSNVRDEHMLGSLLAAVREGQRVFAVVGASHVVMQEPALELALRGARLTRLRTESAP